MEKGKMENQKIEEKDLEKAAGGYSISGDKSPSNFLTVESLKLSEKEYNMLDEANYITRLNFGGESGEYISRSKLKEAFDLLNKKSKFNDSDNNLNHELGIRF